MQNKKVQNLYFIAIVLKGDLGEKITSQKDYMARTYNSKAALRSPPHITLHMPFKRNAKDEDRIIDLLNSVSIIHNPFELTLKNYDCFEPRVIFMDVLASAELNKLQKTIEVLAKRQLNIFNSTHRQHPYKPHITVAFRDLSKQRFISAWDEFRERKFDCKYLCKSVSLLKHDSQKWEELYEFPLRVNH